MYGVKIISTTITQVNYTEVFLGISRIGNFCKLFLFKITYKRSLSTLKTSNGAKIKGIKYKNYDFLSGDKNLVQDKICVHIIHKNHKDKNKMHAVL